MEFRSRFSYSEIGRITIIVEDRMSKVTELRHILENSFPNNDINMVGISVELQDLSFWMKLLSQNEYKHYS